MKKTLRVAHTLLGQHVWGSELYALNLIEALQPFGVETVVICANHGALEERLRPLAIHVECVPIRGYLDIEALLRIRRILKQFEVQLVHAHMGLDSFIGAAVARSLGLPLIASVHFDEPAYMKRFIIIRELWRFVQIIKATGVAHFMPVSSGVAKRLQDRELVPSRKLTVIHPGIKEIAVSPEDVRKNRRLNLGVADDDCVVITVARLSMEKGVDIFIEAVPTIIANNQNIKFWIVGDGPQRQNLQRLIDKLNVGAHVKIWGYQDNVHEWLGLSDIFVLASRLEPFGIAPVEAMLAGLPVVCTRTSGTSETVLDGETGYLVPIENAPALARAVLSLAHDPSLMRTMGAKARQHARRQFSLDSMAQQMFEVYQRFAQVGLPDALEHGDNEG